MDVNMTYTILYKSGVEKTYTFDAPAETMASMDELVKDAMRQNVGGYITLPTGETAGVTISLLSVAQIESRLNSVSKAAEGEQE